MGDSSDSIPRRFETQVALGPDRVALWTPARQYTYQELNREVNRLAHRLQRGKGLPPSPVALLFDQGAASVIAILAVLKAGGFYVPLDPSHPEPYLRGLLADAGAAQIVVADDRLDLGRKLATEGRELVCAGPEDAAFPSENPGTEVGSADLAYLFYTSGSTGRPKGVVDTHRNVLHNILRYTHALRIGPADRLSLLQSPVFSGTVSSLFCALLNGATLCPLDLRSCGFAAVAAWIGESRITVLHGVPSILRGVVHGGRRFPGVRVVRLEGDQVLPEDAEWVRGSFDPECLLAVGLGATETGLSCQHRVRVKDLPRGGTVPIGLPTDDMEISLRDDEGVTVPVGITGEIAVRSRFLASGYWRDPELTARKFRPDPLGNDFRTYFTGDLGRMREDGRVEYLGRKDGAAKVRGQRVEPAEVEAALLQIRGVRQAAVILMEEAPGDARLVAFVVNSPGAQGDGTVLRAELSRRLPEVMIPSEVRSLDRLPVTVHGKVDRQALRELWPCRAVSQTGPSVGTSGESLEDRLARLWQEVHGRGPVPSDADFFDTGGDSLRAANLCQRLEAIVGHPVPPSVLSLHPTLAQLTAWAQGAAPTRDPRLVTFGSGGRGEAVIFVHDLFGSVAAYTALAGHLGEGRSCHALTPIAEVTAPGTPGTIPELAARHLETFRQQDFEGPVHWIGHCFAGVVVLELVRQWEERGGRPGFVGLIGISPHDFPNLVPDRCLRRYRLMNQRSGPMAQWRYLQARIEGLSWGDRYRFLAWRAGHWGDRLLGSLRGDPPPPAPAEAPVIAQYHRTLFAAHNALPVQAEVHLFLSDRDSAMYSPDPAADFAGLSRSGVTVHRIGGTDRTLLSEPAVRELAQRIGSCLPQVHAPPGRHP